MTTEQNPECNSCEQGPGSQCETCPSKTKVGIDKLPVPEHSLIRHAVAVMSGKGGVGKSTVTALVASALAKKLKSVGVLDADITGPSIPKLFGIKDRPEATALGLIPPKSLLGISIMSLNLLLPNEDDPVIWRGPLIGGAVQQFWTDVVWGDLDYLIVDLPPGTGDAPLTVLQSLPLDGIILVSSPQELAVMVVKKAIRMAEMLNVPILGVIENMSYLNCPHCGEKIELFGPSHVRAAAQAENLKFLGALPVDPRLAELGDKGEIEEYPVDFLEGIEDIIGVI
ncbi:MAG: Mrp/NBP35 family ATP-binding protein [Firmicutes bacterium]|jgi:Mrp family chromosome partitioning ATPase|nr:Mrp/NBP35 family ATP-binding protein [Bacillota bacterium]